MTAIHVKSVVMAVILQMEETVVILLVIQTLRKTISVNHADGIMDTFVEKVTIIATLTMVVAEACIPEIS